jgi:hypothetical protein
MVLKLCEDVQQLRKENECLKFHLNRLNISVPGPSLHTIRPSPSAQGSCTPAKEVLPLKTAESAICPDSGTKSYKDTVSAGLKPSNFGAVNDGFTTVTYKKPAPASVPENTIKHRRQPLIGVRNSSNLPIVSKKERSKALFVSRFSPEVSASDKFIKEAVMP